MELKTERAKDVSSVMTNFLGRILFGAILLAPGAHGSALADNPAEKEKLARCAKEICSIVVSKTAKGPDLTCDLVKTWEKEEIQKGADYKHLSWGLGSARCTAKLTAKRADLVAALTTHEYTLKIGKQPVACEIGAEKYSIRATLAPELTFKGGTCTQGAVHMDDIEGATLIKGVVWTAAAIEQHFGIFESDLVREVNRFVQKECPKVLSNAQPAKTETHK
jgi:hypothetical protein